MDRKELEALIPSEAVRKYVMETGWIFTDKEKAALLCHGNRLWKEECSLLKALADKTRDEGLREEITAWLEWNGRALQAFQENGGKQHVYILKVEEKGGFGDGEYLPCGYFFHWEEAFAFGKKENAPFNIEKYRVGGVSEFDDGRCSHYMIGEMRFDENGGIRRVDSDEIPDVCGASPDEMCKHFSEMYFELPNPFERGDIVKTCWGSYGIVGMTSEEWKKRVAKHKGISYADYTDTMIGIDIFERETGFFLPTDDVSPLDLERYEPEWAEGTMDQLLLVAQYIYRDNGYIGSLFYWLEKYRQSIRNK